MPVRLKDIAKRANVSVQVVSAVLHKTSTTTAASAETRDRILRVAQEVGYVPHASASSLARGRSNTIGFICHWLPQSHYSRAMVLAEQICTTHRHALLVSRTDHKPDWATLLQSGRVDLLLTVGLGDLNLAGVRIPKSLQSRIIAIGAYNSDLPVERQWHLQLVWEGQIVGSTAAEHLLALGRKNLVMLAGPHKSYDKAPGFLQRVQQAGLQPLLLHHDEPVDRALAGYRLMNRVIDEYPQADGIFLFADALYPGVAKAICERPWKPARDYSIVGYGGDFDMLDSVCPPLEEGVRMALDAYFAGNLAGLRDTVLKPTVRQAQI